MAEEILPTSNPSAQEVAALLEATARYIRTCKRCGAPIYYLLHVRGPYLEGDTVRLIPHTVDGTVHLYCGLEEVRALREHAAHG